MVLLYSCWFIFVLSYSSVASRPSSSNVMRYLPLFFGISVSCICSVMWSTTMIVLSSAVRVIERVVSVVTMPEYMRLSLRNMSHPDGWNPGARLKWYLSLEDSIFSCSFFVFMSKARTKKTMTMPMTSMPRTNVPSMKVWLDCCAFLLMIITVCKGRLRCKYRNL